MVFRHSPSCPAIQLSFLVHVRRNHPSVKLHLSRLDRGPCPALPLDAGEVFFTGLRFHGAAALLFAQQ